MITFLEYVCERLMGPPQASRSWCCPYHDDTNPSFTVRPPKKRPNGTEYPIKYRCHACGEWGDERDLLRHFYPKDTQAQFVARWKKLLAGYEHLTGQPAPISSRGSRGTSTESLKFAASELRSVIRECGIDWSKQEAGFWALVWACRIAEDVGVDLNEFARHCVSELIASRKPKRKGIKK